MQLAKSETQAEEYTAATVQRNAKLTAFSKRVTSKIAKSYLERSAIFKLRYQAYLRGELIAPNSFRRYVEPADHAANALLIGLYIDRSLIASLRLQIGTKAAPSLTSGDLFPELLQPLLQDDKLIVEMSCIATDGDLARHHFWMPYIILRTWIAAAEYFCADFIATTAEPQHQLFYQKTLGCRAHPEQRPLPYRRGPTSLLTLDFAASAERLYEKLPYLRSTPSERALLFNSDAISAEGKDLRQQSSKPAFLAAKFQF
jgi:hypothetical protein